MKKTILFAALLMLAACSKAGGPNSSDLGATNSGLKQVPVTTASAEARAAFNRGRQALDNIRQSAAAEHFRKAIKLDPKFAQAIAILASITPGAEGKRLAEQAAGLSAKLPEAERLVIRMSVAGRHHKKKESYQALERLGTLVPGDWRVQLKLGSHAFFSGKTAKAVDILRRAAGLNPAAGEIYNMLGYALDAQGKVDESIAALKRYAELKPGEANPHDSLGEILMKAGRLAEAERSYLKATRVSSKFWNAWQGLALVRYARGNWAGGHAALAKAKAAVSEPKMQLKIDKMKAMALASEGKGDASMSLLQSVEKRAMVMGMKKAWAWAPISQAWSLAESGRPADAVAKIDEAFGRFAKAGLTAKKRRDMGFWANVAKVWALAKLGKTDEAREVAGKLKAFALLKKKSKKVQSAMALVRGALALAAGDARAAAGQFAQCLGKDSFCQLQLVRAREKAGMPTAKIRAKLLGGLQRDMLHVWVRAQLSGDRT